MDFGRQRGFLLDGEDPPEKVGCTKDSYFLEFMYVDVARDFVGVVFHVLLDGAKFSHKHGDCCCFEPPHSLNFDFQVLRYLLVSGGIVMSMRRQVLSFLFFSTMSGVLAAMVPSVWVSMSPRVVTLLFSLTVLGSCSYHRSFTSMSNSLQIFQCICAAALLWRWIFSVLASSGQPETKWSMVSSKRPHSLYFGSTSGFLRVLVPACWEALILGCDDKALGFCLEASCV